MPSLLIVDDEANILTSLQGALGREGYQVEGVANVAEVRARLAEASDVVLTRVHVRAITPEELRWYVASGEPMGKAGAYGIQGRAARFIDWIEGSWSNVVGLPVATVDRLLKGLGA